MQRGHGLGYERLLKDRELAQLTNIEMGRMQRASFMRQMKRIDIKCVKQWIRDIDLEGNTVYHSYLIIRAIAISQLSLPQKIQFLGTVLEKTQMKYDTFHANCILDTTVKQRKKHHS